MKTQKPKPFCENPKNPSLFWETQKSLNENENENVNDNDNVNENENVSLNENEKHFSQKERRNFSQDIKEAEPVSISGKKSAFRVLVRYYNAVADLPPPHLEETAQKSP